MNAPAKADSFGNQSSAIRTQSSAISRALPGAARTLSCAQEAMLFFDKFAPGCPAYNCPAALRLQGPLDSEALRKSMALSVARHEALRSNFAFVDGEPTELVTWADDFELPVVDVSSAFSGGPLGTLHDAIRCEARRPFILATDLMLRGVLFRIHDSEHVLALTAHHIAFDGWSLGVLLGELCDSYNSFAAGTLHTPPPLDLQYADFAEGQRRLLCSPALDRLSAYWKKQLAGLGDSWELIPTDRARTRRQSFEGALETVRISPELADSLAKIARSCGATLFMIMAAALQILLQRYSGQDDIVLGVPVANRGCREYKKLIGCFINTVPLRANLSGNPTFLQAASRVREASLNAYVHQDLPFAEIARLARPKRSVSTAPVFQVEFIFQNYPMPATEWSGLRAELLKTHTGTAKFDVSVFVDATPQGLEVSAEYNSELFTSGSMARLLANYLRILESVASDPAIPLASLSM